MMKNNDDQFPPKRVDNVPYGTDETLFRSKLITPDEPVSYVQNDKGETFQLPGYSHTMSIGNFDTPDLEAARLCFTIARVAESHGYYGIAIEWLTRIVDLSVSSLAYQGKLLTQLTTQHYGIYRKEESPEDSQNSSAGGGIVDKINKLRQMDQSKSRGDRYDLSTF